MTPEGTNPNPKHVCKVCLRCGKRTTSNATKTCSGCGRKTFGSDAEYNIKKGFVAMVHNNTAPPDLAELIRQRMNILGDEFDQLETRRLEILSETTKLGDALKILIKEE